MTATSDRSRATAGAPPRPIAPPVRAEGIPAALAALPQWVCWDYTRRGDDWTKVPYQDRGRLARADDPATWLPLADALARRARHGFAGVGFVFSAADPFCGIDLDDARDPATGALTTQARTILAELDSYAEISPSGRGLHVIGAATLPAGRGRKHTALGIELYDRGRVFTVTGDRLPDSPDGPRPCQAALDELHARLFPVAPSPPSPGRPAGPSPAPPDDAALLARIRASRQGPLFDRLWAGDTSGHHGDDSSADLALCNVLAFWCGDDPDRIDRLFRASGLSRPKWERADYRAATIGRALADRAATYDPGHGGSRVARLGAAGEAGDAADPNDYAPTDLGNARLFAARLGGALRYDHRRGAWLRWHGHWWRLDDDGHATRLAGQVAAWRHAAVADLADDERRKEARRWAKSSEGRARIDAILTLGRALEPLAAAGDAWDADDHALGVANGVIDLRTGTLRPGRPADNITLRSPVAYDPDATAPRWLRFLDEVFRGDAELIGYVRRFAGYSLTGDTREAKLLICWGSGANGKSTLLTALAHVVGDYGYAMPFSTVEAQRQPGGPTNDLAALAGRRLVISSEVNEGQPLNEARIKALTGGDPITARFLNREFFTFQPAAKFWLAVNHTPRVRDESRGFWRRIALLPFLASFEGREDPALHATLRAEAPGILAWLVRGCLEWQRRGLGEPGQVAAATAEYARESDPLADFLAEVCVVGEHQAARGNALYHAYLDWAADQGIRDKATLDHRRFGQLLAGRFARQRDGQGVLYRGLGVALAWQERARPARGRV